MAVNMPYANKVVQTSLKDPSALAHLMIVGSFIGRQTILLVVDAIYRGIKNYEEN